MFNVAKFIQSHVGNCKNLLRDAQSPPNARWLTWIGGSKSRQTKMSVVHKPLLCRYILQHIAHKRMATQPKIVSQKLE